MISRIAIFTDRYPLIGPLVWLFCLQYFIVQAIVASAWHTLRYSWTANVISDLGNTAISPWHVLMNFSFIVLGITMAVGSLLIFSEFRESRLSLISFSLMAIAGLGTILVGVFPENTISSMHNTGAFLAFGLGNLAILILSFAIRRAREEFRMYTLVTGAITLIAFIVFLTGIHTGLGQGTIERIVSYPQTIWLILFGYYMTKSHWRHIERKNNLTLE